MNENSSTPGRRRADSRTVKALRGSVVEGMCHAVMLGLSESYLGAFAVALGHGALALALLASVPLLVGAIAQLLAGPVVVALGGRKRLVALGAAVQGVSVLGFVALALADDRRLWPFLLIKSLFWAAGAIISPAWGAWMSTLTEKVRRERYFGVRSSMVEAALLISFLAAGVWLNQGTPTQQLTQFGVLFGLAAVARGASVGLLARQYDPLASSGDAGQVPGRLGLATRTSKWRVALYLGVLMGGAQIAIPYFTPYMLRELNLGFGDFALLLALSILAKAITFPLCHRVVAVIGLRRLLFISGAGVAVLPVLWVYFTSVAALGVIQLLGGVTWAGLEYASFQLLLRSAKSECQLEFLSLSSFLTSTLQLGGGLAGSWLLADLGASYHMVFNISAGARLVALGVLVVAIRPMELAAAVPRLFVRLTGVRATGGAVRGPLLEQPPPHEGGDAPGP